MEHMIALSLSALQIAILVSGPVLLASLIVGFGLAMLQGMTQIQDFTLSFVPKLITVSLILALTARWIGAQILRFTIEAWSVLPQ